MVCGTIAAVTGEGSPPADLNLPSDAAITLGTPGPVLASWGTGSRPRFSMVLSAPARHSWHSAIRPSPCRSSGPDCSRQGWRVCRQPRGPTMVLSAKVLRCATRADLDDTTGSPPELTPWPTPDRHVLGKRLWGPSGGRQPQRSARWSVRLACSSPSRHRDPGPSSSLAGCDLTATQLTGSVLFGGGADVGAFTLFADEAEELHGS
jgi:hypothetical protein